MCGAKSCRGAEGLDAKSLLFLFLMKDIAYLLEYNPPSLCHLWETQYLVFIKQLICNRQNQIIILWKSKYLLENFYMGQTSSSAF